MAIPASQAAATPPPVLYERVPCAICSGDRLDIVHAHPRDRLHGFEHKADLVRCAQCGLVQTQPRPTRASVGAFYPTTYGPYSAAVAAAHSGLKFRLWKVAYDTLTWPYRLRYHDFPRTPSPPPSGGRILDVGCASGAFLEQMSAMGWNVAGIEPNAQAAAVACRRRGVGAVNVHVGRAEDIELAAESYDLITMTHVIEHLHDPRAVLEKVRNWLKPNGVVVIRCPNFGSIERRLFGQSWLGLEMPRHLYHFEPETIRNLLRRAGLNATRIVAEAQTASFSGSIALTTDTLLRHRRTQPVPNWVHHILMPLGALMLAAGAGGTMEVTAVRADAPLDATLTQSSARTRR